MEAYTKIKYMPLKYKTETKSISIQKDPKEAILNSIGLNQYKSQGHKREFNFNTNTMIYSNNNNYNANYIKNKFLNYQYNNKDQLNNPNYNLNKNNNNNIYNNNYNNVAAHSLNKTTPHYYSTKLKDKILNNLRDNFQTDKIKKKKALYVNVNFNLNQNYSMPNYGNKKNRSLSVQNNYDNKMIKNNDGIINNINKNINNKKIINNNNIYFESFCDTGVNKTLNPIYDKEKQILNLKKNYNYNNQNKNTNLAYKRNPSYTKILNYRSLDFPTKESLNINLNNKNSNKFGNAPTNIKINDINNLNNNQQVFNNNKNSKNINVFSEPNNAFKHNIYNKESQINYYLYNLELKMQKLLGENKTESKGKNYNIVRKIFEEGINIMNLPQIEKNFLKLMMIKYHDIVYAFSQENKYLKQSSENLQNLNFSLDKKCIDLDKKYKLLLKENEEMKKVLSSKNIDNKIIIDEADGNKDMNNNKKLNINEINNNMYKSIKDMDFIINDSISKEEEDNNKVEKLNDKDNHNFIKLNNSIINENKEIKIKQSKEDNNLKNDNYRKKIEMLNRMNIKDLDSLYFNDKINNISTQNSQKNYDKVPKIRFNDK